MHLEDELLERYGTYYSSEYVMKNQPWILEVPFFEWVERQLSLRMKRLECSDPYMLDLFDWPYEDAFEAPSISLPETA
jgi:hypothetical protein